MPHLPASLPFAHILERATADRFGQVVELRELPYRSFAASFDQHTCAGVLDSHCTSIRLYAYRQRLKWQSCLQLTKQRQSADSAVANCRATGAQLAALTDSMLEACSSNGKPPGSYNVLLTKGYLQLIPRSAEFSGPVAVNALVRLHEIGSAKTSFLTRLKHPVARSAWSHLSEIHSTRACLRA